MKIQFHKPENLFTSLAWIGLLGCLFFLLQASTGSAEETAPQWVWVLAETQVNPNNEPLEFYGGGKTPGFFSEPRFEGKFLIYHVSETSFQIDDRDVDHGYENHNVTIYTYFEKPPLQLIPGETSTLNVKFEHSGSAVDAGATVQFWYSSENVNIEPDEVFGYAPWSQYFSGDDTTTYTIVVPPASSDAEISIVASWWNCGACVVIWTYKAAQTGNTADGNISTEQADVPEEDIPSNSDESSRQNPLPPWITNPQIVRDYDGLVYEVPQWLDWIKPKQVIRSRGMVIEPRGEVWVYSAAFNKWSGPISGNTPIYTGDMVATGPGSTTRVHFTNGVSADTISVGVETLLEVPEAVEENVSDYPSLWILYTGLVKIKRAILREAPAYPVNPFLVRTPTIVAGSRGTEFILSYDSATQTSNLYLISGKMDYYNLAAGGSEDALLSAGNILTVQKNGDETVDPYNPDELDALISENNLTAGDSMTPEEWEKLFPEEEAQELDATTDSENTANAPQDTQPTPTSLAGYAFLAGGALVCGIGLLGVLGIVMYLTRGRKQGTR